VATTHLIVVSTAKGWKISRYFRKYQNIENIKKYHYIFDIFDIFQKMQIFNKLYNSGVT